MKTKRVLAMIVMALITLFFITLAYIQKGNTTEAVITTETLEAKNVEMAKRLELLKKQAVFQVQETQKVDQMAVELEKALLECENQSFNTYQSHEN